VRTRFQEFLDTRSRATRRAIGYAVANVQQGLHYVVAENVDAAGNLHVGNFVVTVDDGSGAPSASLLASVGLAVEAVRPVGSTYSVQPPVVIEVDISVVIAIAPDATQANITAAVGQAILSYVNALPIGAALPLSRIAQIAHDADPAVISASQVLLNSSSSDISPPANGVIKTGIVTVT